MAARAVQAVTVSALSKGTAVLRMTQGENRVNQTFIDSFHRCLDHVESEKSYTSLITTAEGKFFSNGLDLDWLMQHKDPEFFESFIQKLNQLVARILTFPVPTAAAINGHCFAAGAMVAFAHDVRVMNNEKGWLCYNEVFINKRLAPFIMKVMQMKAEPKVYHNMMVFGQRFTGPEAEAVGLVDKAVAAATVESETELLLASWMGKHGFDRQSLQNMKTDVFADALSELNKPTRAI